MKSMNAAEAAICAAIHNMKESEQDPIVQRDACDVIRNLVNAEPLQTWFGRKGGMQCVMRAVKNHMNNAAVVTSACHAIGMLCYMNRVNRREVDLADVTAAMRTHPRSASVQRACLAALLDATSDLSMERAAELLTAAAAGPPALDIMCGFAKDIPARADACDVLVRSIRGIVVTHEFARRAAHAARLLMSTAIEQPDVQVVCGDVLASTSPLVTGPRETRETLASVLAAVREHAPHEVRP